MIGQVLFGFALLLGGGFFAYRVSKIRRNILLGRDVDMSDHSSQRWKTMAKVAIGQSKMVVRPISGFFHIIVYLGFVIINIEVLEIVIDGLFGTHRIFAPFLGSFYDFLIGSFEILALGVLVACVIFLIRRNVLKIKRFFGKEMTAWPKSDANMILIIEIALMAAFLKMNAADQVLQARGAEHYTMAGSFPISSMLVGFYTGISTESLILVERATWWFHILGILAFLNYIPFSKHFHIFLAFPNTFYSRLDAKGKMTNMASITTEVKAMMDPSFQPPADQPPPDKFGVKDVFDLNWKNLMEAYSCTECGRCTSQCPASLTGKLLSPRKVMMDTRDRLEEVGKNIDKNKEFKDDGKSLHDLITKEELLACTTCNACVEACPVNISPVEIIMEMRRYKVMEESDVPQEWNMMLTNLENNGAPWQFSPTDRAKWTETN
ncbi:MAG: heterodisulfide reductase subunit C [Sphingobacteriales bacterium]|jgi:heterodisulfide reductase subunit C